MTLKTEVKAGWFFVFFFVIFSFARGENAPFSHSEHTHTHMLGVEASDRMDVFLKPQLWRSGDL